MLRAQSTAVDKRLKRCQTSGKCNSFRGQCDSRDVAYFFEVSIVIYCIYRNLVFILLPLIFCLIFLQYPFWFSGFCFVLGWVFLFMDLEHKKVMLERQQVPFLWEAPYAAVSSTLELHVLELETVSYFSQILCFILFWLTRLSRQNQA